jgi:sugar (pentulose or hexulose) kinase
MEGTAFELEFIRRAGEQMTGQKIPSLVAAGGGTRYVDWMQIKADVSGCQIDVSGEPEATLLGSAMAAGIGCGLFSSTSEALTAMGSRDAETFLPNMEKHSIYQDLYQRGYLNMQEALRRYTSNRRAAITE